MQYDSVHDETYRNRDITIYTLQDGSHVVDVKKPCGELIAGWLYIESFESGLRIARDFIASGNRKPR